MKNKIELIFNKTKLEFFYGLSFLGEFLDKNNIDVDELNKRIINNSLSFLPTLMYESYLHNCNRNGEKPVVNKLELIDLIEQTGYFKDDSVAGEFVTAFYKSIFVTFGLEQEKGEQTEKKN